MRKRLAETPFSCAFGYASVQDRKDIEEVVKKADQAMYENKAELKKRSWKAAENCTGEPRILPAILRNGIRDRRDL